MTQQDQTAAETLAMQYGAMNRASLGAMAAYAAAGAQANPMGRGDAVKSASTPTNGKLDDATFAKTAGVIVETVRKHRRTWDGVAKLADAKALGMKPAAEMNPTDELDELVEKLNVLTVKDGDREVNVFTYHHPDQVSKRAKADKEAKEAKEAADAKALEEAKDAIKAAKGRGLVAVETAENTVESARKTFEQVEADLTETRELILMAETTDAQRQPHLNRLTEREAEAKALLDEADKAYAAAQDRNNKNAWPPAEESWPEYAEKIERLAAKVNAPVSKFATMVTKINSQLDSIEDTFGAADRKDADGVLVDHSALAKFRDASVVMSGVRKAITDRTWDEVKDGETLKTLRNLAKGVQNDLNTINVVLGISDAEAFDSGLAEILEAGK